MSKPEEPWRRWQRAYRAAALASKQKQQPPRGNTACLSEDAKTVLEACNSLAALSRMPAAAAGAAMQARSLCPLFQSSPLLARFSPLTLLVFTRPCLPCPQPRTCVCVCVCVCVCMCVSVEGEQEAGDETTAWRWSHLCPGPA
jgi:hypothetical protein